MRSEQSLVSLVPTCLPMPQQHGQPYLNDFAPSQDFLSTGSRTQALNHEQDAPGTGRCSLPWGLDELRRTADKPICWCPKLWKPEREHCNTTTSRMSSRTTPSSAAQPAHGALPVCALPGFATKVCNAGKIQVSSCYMYIHMPKIACERYRTTIDYFRWPWALWYLYILTTRSAAQPTEARKQRS